jgi:hypothetical protein
LVDKPNRKEEMIMLWSMLEEEDVKMALFGDIIIENIDGRLR